MFELFYKKLANLFFLFVFLIFILSNYLIYQHMLKLKEANNWVNHTHLVIEHTDEALLALAQSTSALRIYFSTNEASYLKTYQKIWGEYQDNLAAIVALTNDNLLQQQKLKALEPYTKEAASRSLEIIHTFQTQGSTKAINASLSADFRLILFNIQQILREIIASEIDLLKTRSNNALVDNHVSNQTIIFVSALSDILLLLTFIFFKYHLKERKKAERERLNVENRLKGIIEGNNDLILALSSDYKVMVFNSAYENLIFKLLGKHIEVGIDFKKFISPMSNYDLIISNWDRVFKNEEFTVIEPIGESNYYEISFNTIEDIDHKQIGASAVFRDVTKRRLDEINLKAANEKLEIGLLKLEERYKEITLLNDLSEALQSCLTAEEAFAPIKTYCKLILPYEKGVLFLMHSSKNYLELATNWGDLNITETFFPPQQCWALRRNQMHKVEKPQHSIICEHVYNLHSEAYPYVCVPLMAHNETLGLLYLEVPTEEHKLSGNSLLDEHARLLLVTTAEQISLAIANIKLRETLRFLSIRDPLTGLYNRRYLEETLPGEILRAERNHTAFALIMIDIDHFKLFNDTHGHEAGDNVLSHIGKLFQDRVRGSDIVCRFGGEEFIMVLCDSNAHSAKAFAERVRMSVHHLSIKYGVGNLSAVTISQGIAMFPMNGRTLKDLIEAADKALYRAKAAGRDRVVFAGEDEQGC